jgi:hypothetical protein
MIANRQNGPSILSFCCPVLTRKEVKFLWLTLLVNNVLVNNNGDNNNN